MPILAILFAIISFIFVLFTLLIKATAFVFEGLAFSSLTKDRAISGKWLVWVPFADRIGKVHLMSELSETDSFCLFGDKLVFKNKMTPIWVYLAVTLCLTQVELLQQNVYLALIVSILGSLPILVANAFIVIMEYGYLRDLLNAYSENQGRNRTVALLVTLFDTAAFGLVRAIYLFVIRNRTPLSELPEAEELP